MFILYFVLNANYLKKGNKKGKLVAVLGIVDSKKDKYCVLGTNFFRKYYTMFDFEKRRIGFMRPLEQYHTWSLVIIGSIITAYAIYAITVDRAGNYGASVSNVYEN